MWPSMKTELPHNFIVVISVNSGAVLSGAPNDQIFPNTSEVP